MQSPKILATWTSAGMFWLDLKVKNFIWKNSKQTSNTFQTSQMPLLIYSTIWPEKKKKTAQVKSLPTCTMHMRVSLLQVASVSEKKGIV